MKIALAVVPASRRDVAAPTYRVAPEAYLRMTSGGDLAEEDNTARRFDNVEAIVERSSDESRTWRQPLAGFFVQHHRLQSHVPVSLG